MILLVLAAACTPGEVDLTDKGCPCAVGWHCDEDRWVCVRGALETQSETPVDAGPDRSTGDGDSGSPVSPGGADADTGPATTPDAGAPSDAAVLDSPDSGSPEPDATEPTCTPGEQLGPTSAFVGFPELGNTVCAVEEVLVRDGSVAGLDRPGTGALGMIDGHGVTACVGVDFGRVESFPDIVVRAQGTGDGCGIACESTSCGASVYMRVFRAETDGAWVNADYHVALTRNVLTDYRIVLDGPTRYVLVCRGGAGYRSDDVAVDSIVATCPP